MCKKILAILIAAAMLFSMIAVAATAEETSKYPDVPGDYWAKGAIDRWDGYGIIKGKKGKFEPGSDMKRAEFATVMVRLLGLTTMPESNPFTDVNEGDWFYEDVLKAYAAGIIKGTTPTTAAPNALIERQQAFVMMARALGVTPKENVTDKDFSKFTDGLEMNNYAKGYTAALIEAGFVGGSGGKLTPKDDISRAEVVTLLNKTVTTYVNTPGVQVTNTPDANGRVGFVVINTTGEVTVTGNSAGVVVGEGAKDSTITLYDGKVGDSVKIDAAGATVNLTDTMVSNNVVVDAGEVTVSLSNSQVAGTLTLTENADDATVEVPAGSTVETVDTSADNVSISGTGDVGEVTVSGGDQVEITTPGTHVDVSEGAGSVTANGVTVAPGTSGTTAGAGDGFTDTGTTGEPSTPPSTPVSTPVFKTVRWTDSSVFEAEAEAFLATFYNKGNPTNATRYIPLASWSAANGVSGVDADDVEPAWYITIPFNTGKSGFYDSDKTYTVTLNDTDVDTMTYISVGNKNWIEGPSYKVTSDGLSIALPVIAMETSSKLTFTVTPSEGDAEEAVISYISANPLSFTGAPETMDSAHITIAEGGSATACTINPTSAATHNDSYPIKFTLFGEGLITESVPADQQTIYFTKKVNPAWAYAGPKYGKQYGVTTSDYLPNNNLIVYLPTTTDGYSGYTYTVMTADRLGPAEMTIAVGAIPAANP